MNSQTCDQQSKESQDLATIWYRCVARDTDWASLVQRVDPMLRSTLAGLGRSYGVYLNRDLLDEVIQEIYVRLLRNDRRVLRGCRAESETTIRSYLRRVARSTLIDWLRARRALKRGPAAELSLDVLNGLADEVDGFEVPSRTSSPLDAIYARELRGRFRRECGCVANSGGTVWRDIWITERMVVDGWSSREAARVVQLAPATVATVLSRMRRELRRRGLFVPSRLNPGA